MPVLNCTSKFGLVNPNTSYKKRSKLKRVRNHKQHFKFQTIIVSHISLVNTTSSLTITYFLIAELPSYEKVPYLNSLALLGSLTDDRRDLFEEDAIFSDQDALTGIKNILQHIASNKYTLVVTDIVVW